MTSQPFCYEPNVNSLVSSGGRNSGVLGVTDGIRFPFKKVAMLDPPEPAYIFKAANGSIV
ncbi:Aldehyde dehydrogenase [Bacillus pseudomycoides]